MGNPFREQLNQERLYREAKVINQAALTKAVIKAVLATALIFGLLTLAIYTAVESSHSAAVRQHMLRFHPNHH